MIPPKIQPYFELTSQKKDGENSLFAGELVCCDSHDFEVLVIGKVQHDIFSKMNLYPDNDKIVMEVRCRKCGKVIPVFDSCYDGYEQCTNYRYVYRSAKPIACTKCQSNNFRVNIKYEYPDVNELEKLEIVERDNAFTWIWVALECNECGTRYKKFIDCETT